MSQEIYRQQVRDILAKSRISVVTLLATLSFVLSDFVSLAPAQTFTTLHIFASTSLTDGNDGFGGFIQSGSILYGMTFSNGVKGGNLEGGTIFQFDLNSDTETVLHNFPNLLPVGSNDGRLPYGSLIQSGSTLFGMTSRGGGGSGYGTIFQYSLGSNTESILHRFNGNDGAGPYGNLTQSGSDLYGMTNSGGSLWGNIFDYNINTGAEVPLYSFNPSAGDGELPEGSLIQSGSVLYGMTPEGGASKDGIIFQYNLTTGKESILHSFTGTDGATPGGSLTQSGSMLYGLTEYGGIYNLGTLFQYNLNNGQETVLHSFGGPGDGTYPTADLLLSGSILYGSTDAGGSVNDGTIFQFDLSTDTETLLHQFGGPDGGYVPPQGFGLSIPEGDLTLSGSTLYGMTPDTIFALQLPEPTGLMTLTLGTIFILRRRCRSIDSPKSA